MDEILIKTENRFSKIILGERLQNLHKYIPVNKKTIIITDRNLNHFYHEAFNPFPVIELGLGEENKSLATIDFIMGKLISLEADRTSFIVGVGGGIITDITGFAASVFMRGVRFGFVSTSLLSQVDASVGGKNGVNYLGFKNMVGVFNQPDFVLCDVEMLRTLDSKEYINGFAEIIKHAAIKSPGMLAFLEKNYPQIPIIRSNDNKGFAEGYNFALSQVENILIKSAIVEMDEREKGERKKLNFGHTFAHSFEKHTALSHGEAVAVGMVMASRLSVKKGLLSQVEADRLEMIIRNVGLPTGVKIDKKILFEGMKKDKKREGDRIHVVLLKGLGNAIIENISFNELEEITNDLCCTI